VPILFHALHFLLAVIEGAGDLPLLKYIAHFDARDVLRAQAAESGAVIAAGRFRLVPYLQ